MVTNKKFGVVSGSSIAYYKPDIYQAYDYYPFGWPMPGRTWEARRPYYRYGFNGKENDNEVKGKWNQQDYGMRIYDPRVGRFLSVDPITRQYPELTLYQFASNRPIDGVDRDSLEWELSTVNNNLNRQGERSGINDPILNFLKYSPSNQEIMLPDMYGTTIIGKRKDVEFNIAYKQQVYNEAVAENIRQGPGGAIGYWVSGGPGSFVGASFDQISMSFSGLPGRGYSTKPGNPTQEPAVENTGQVTRAHSGSLAGAQRQGLMKGTLSDVEARQWYLSREAQIPNMLNKKLPLMEQAKQAFNLRNQFRTEARELMADRAKSR